MIFSMNEKLRQELVDIVHDIVYKYPVGEDVNCYDIVDSIMCRLKDEEKANEHS